MLRDNHFIKKSEFSLNFFHLFESSCTKPSLFTGKCPFLVNSVILYRHCKNWEGTYISIILVFPFSHSFFLTSASSAKFSTLWKEHIVYNSLWQVVSIVLYIFFCYNSHSFSWESNAAVNKTVTIKLCPVLSVFIKARSLNFLHQSFMNKMVKHTASSYFWGTSLWVTNKAGMSIMENDGQDRVVSLYSYKHKLGTHMA